MSLTGPVSSAYEALVKEGAIDGDAAQRKAALLLDGIAVALAEEQPSGIAGFFQKRKSAPKGAYIFGEVGRGKSMLMDLFYDHVPISEKRRVHFHQFMDEVHSAIAEFRQSAADDKGARDPIPHAVKPIIKSTRLLCLDEFHVQDITNAMLLQRLFEKLFGAGIVLVATSNVAPDGLYKDGLNRQLFLPFIDLLKSHAHVHELGADKDYRLEKLSGVEMFHFGPGGHEAMDRIWSQLTGGQRGVVGHLRSLGRDILVPQQAMGVARFKFADLCDAPLGARDYLRLAHEFHSIVLENIPQFTRANSNPAKRFILLIDALYDRGVKLAASFEVPLSELGGDRETAFEFQRCQSRLIEMQSDEYLAQPLRGK